MVAGLHIAVLFVIARSLGIGASIEPPPPIETNIYEEKRPPEVVPPMPEPEVNTTRQSVVLPLVPIDEMAFEAPDVITGPPPELPYVEDPPPVAPPVKIVGVRQDPRHPLSKPEYSPRMIREGNQGTIEVEVFVQPNGRVADARVVKSTGFAELDLAAIAEAKRNWKLLPATRDGVPIAQWHRLKVTFRLNER